MNVVPRALRLHVSVPGLFYRHNQSVWDVFSCPVFSRSLAWYRKVSNRPAPKPLKAGGKLRDVQSELNPVSEELVPNVSVDDCAGISDFDPTLCQEEVVEEDECDNQPTDQAPNLLTLMHLQERKRSELLIINDLSEEDLKDERLHSACAQLGLRLVDQASNPYFDISNLSEMNFSSTRRLCKILGVKGNGKHSLLTKRLKRIDKQLKAHPESVLHCPQFLPGKLCIDQELSSLSAMFYPGPDSGPDMNSTEPLTLSHCLAANKSFHALVQELSDADTLRKSAEDFVVYRRNRRHRVPKRIIPSVTQVLQETQSSWLLEKWRQEQVELLGQKAFDDAQKKTVFRGTSLHRTLESYLEDGASHISPKIRHYWQSVCHVLPDISDVKAQECFVFHPRLHYSGFIDCVASYKGKQCVIDWKTSKKYKPGFKTNQKYILQVAAYVGALNFDIAYPFQISNSAVVTVYGDGTPALVHFMDRDSMKEAWIEWLSSLAEFKNEQKSTKGRVWKGEPLSNNSNSIELTEQDLDPPADNDSEDSVQL